ncbi:PilZ domain-containing protein [Marinovum sp.]|uniref:PilZ domain-containing protein n=1 Tax=Marinovum sp. TaxID=2024839 RepID=UPI002B26F743|nr:PilZ domain-containing protein [Marinovum sp.]
MRSDFRPVLAICLLLALTGPARAAEGRCHYEEWLLGLIYQSETMVDEIEAAGRTRHGAVLAITLAAHDSAALRRARQRDGYDAYAPLVARHVAAARALLARSSARPALLSSLRTSTAQLLAAVAQVDCAAKYAPTAAASAQSGTRTVGTSGGSGVRLAMDWTAAPVFLLGLGLLGGLVLLERRTRSRKRRNQRFVCDIACSVRVGGTAHDSRIIDISAAGAKLKLGLEGGGDQPVEITSGAFRTAGRVAWSNAHYCGVVFDRPLSADVLQQAILPRAGAA